MAKTSQTITAYENLKKRTEQGLYSPVESLPEIELADEYNVSRNTIKKAPLMLEKDAFVTIEQNRGAKVRSYSKVEVVEYLELREELEGFIVRLTVPCFDSRHTKQLDSLLEEMAEHRRQSDSMTYSAYNQRFHDIIYDVCPSWTIVDVIVRLKKQMKKYNGKTILIPGRGDNSFQEHKAIVDVIKEKDSALAESCIRTHIRNVRNTFEEYYSLLFQILICPGKLTTLTI